MIIFGVFFVILKVVFVVEVGVRVCGGFVDGWGVEDFGYGYFVFNFKYFFYMLV